MDFELSEDQRAFQQTARDFAAGELAPHAAKWDAEAIFPVDVIAKAGELGFCGLYTPEEVGGLGLSRLDATIVFEELARGCTSTTAYLTIHNMVSWMIANWATPAVKDAWCGKLAVGQKLGSYCLTEPGSGSDAASLKTSAVLTDGYYVINGSKAFISGAGSTDVLVLMARTGAGGAHGVSAFVVPADAPGISYGRKEEKMGWNSQPTRTISFDNVRIPADHLLGQEGEGFRLAMRGLDGGRINIATCSVGTAQAALDAAHAYMSERRQFNRPLSDFQALQFKLADMQTELVAARQMVRLAACKLDAKDPNATTYCAMAKRFATDIGFQICNEALQIHGGYGYIREYPLERHFRDVRVHQILEGTNEIMRVIIARQLLGNASNEDIR
ncbi:acyl-CoA dehydrogenase family protein [Collimonas pratensis]|uniref:Acyl-CoA dehydrogenase, N-terminal domain protein n=1 Tax=Collimonas pratensis TaxID=279113 RepID=A0A127PZ05_9BURK|nr:acyl-CoA dehydrogenase family protein [Collimonas pratensis]AMP03028.1 acyl-CoA dehydrogenase, N-terminal domain protein [Collimonas pratensis]AMP12855.1 acyl-CoA dehydrogenase, N-terminal domain protein [Collimonas pratensis]NKI71787.1 acyl-CoA dehydrogenase [Collimonas pratensis]